VVRPYLLRGRDDSESPRTPIAVDAFGTIKIDLPEIGTLVGVVTFESHTGRLINEARAIPIPARNCVAH